MTCRVFLIRHGETVWNQDARFQGWADIPLSNNGVQQAEALGRRLAGQDIAAFFSSHLSRARETAAIIARPHNKPVQVVPGLQEINFGDWEGLTFKEIRQKYSKEFMAWWNNPLQTRIPGGETLAELVERSARALKDIVDNHPGQQVAVVAHGGTIRSIVGMVLGLDLNYYWRLRQDNASLSIIDFHRWDSGVLVLYNDCSHLSSWQVPPF